MQIYEIRIEGYGLFKSQTLGPLERLVVVEGPNEAGKTTLLSFIRAVLFGFPSGNTKENRYQPMLGGIHGGALVLSRGNGSRFRVQRFAGPHGGTPVVTSLDDEIAEAVSLPGLLGNASKELFRNVFAFSLSELQVFETLSKDEVKAQIYNVAAGAGRVPVTDAESTIVKQQGRLYKTAGNSHIKELFRELVEVQSRLKGAISRVDGYRDLKRALEEKEGRSTDARQAYREAGQQLRHVQSLLQAWHDWIDLRTASEQLNALPGVELFPAQGLTRLETLLERQRAKDEELGSATSELRIREEELAGLEVDERVLAAESNIERLHRRLDHYESAAHDLPGLRERLRLSQETYSAALRTLGPSWSNDHITAFDSDIPTIEAIRSYRDRLAEAARRVHDTQNSLRSVRVNLQAAQTQFEHGQEALNSAEMPVEKDLEELDSKRESARRLYDGLVERRDRLTRRKALEDRAAEAQDRLDSLRGRSIGTRSSTPRWQPGAVCMAAGILIVSLAMLDLVLIAGGIAVLFLSAAGLYVYSRRRLAAGSLAADGALGQETSAVGEHLVTIEGEIASLNVEIEQTERETARMAKNLGVAEVGFLQDVRKVEDGLERQSRLLTAWQMREANLKELTWRLEETKQQDERAAAATDEAKEELQKAKGQWYLWLQSRSLDQQLTPEGALDILSRLEVVKEKLAQLHELEQRVRAVREEAEEFEIQVASVASSCGLPSAGGQPCLVGLHQLISALQVARQAQARRIDLQTSITEATDRLELVHKSAGEASQEIARLFALASVNDEESFRQRAGDFERREEAVAVVTDRTRRIEHIAGTGPALERFLGELSCASPRELSELERKLVEQVEDLDGQRGELERARGDLARQISELEKTNEIIDLQLEAEVLREKLATAAKDWAVATIAKKLIGDTRALYERERQPSVIREAQRFFGQITNDRYQRLVAPLGEQRLSVEDRYGNTKEVVHLSRGTSEQLYLALRFGLIREFGRHSEPLPVVLDDVLVNFDIQRARQACYAIAELAQTNQVILFSCHPGTAELLRSAGGLCQVIELSGTA